MNWSSSAAVDEDIATGRAAIQAVLLTENFPSPARSADVVRWGRQRLSKLSKPRLRKRSGGEVKVPAYEAMQDDERLGARMLDILAQTARPGCLCGLIFAHSCSGETVRARRH